jgi:urease accessory protein UreF
MGLTDREKEWASKASRFIKAETKRAGIGYRELAERLNAHGLQETEDSIASKLARGTFSVTFFLACLAVLGLDQARLLDL